MSQISGWVYSKIRSGKRHAIEEEEEEAKEAFLPPIASSSTEAFALNHGTDWGNHAVPYLITSNIVLLSIIAWLLLPRGLFHHSEINSLLKQTSAFSPVLEKVEIPTKLTRMNGTLLTPIKDPPWSRQLFTNETEAHWHTFDLPWTIALSAEEVRKLGKDPATVANFTEDWGFGENSYMAQIDVFHQLHCLNQLRTVAFKDHPHNPKDPPKDHGKLWWMHMEHCVDMLLQNLICNANTDLITLQWMETQPHPMPDFAIDHQCRDLDAISTWQEKVGVNFEGLMTVKMPGDAHIVPVEEGYWDLFGVNGSNHFDK